MYNDYISLKRKIWSSEINRAKLSSVFPIYLPCVLQFGALFIKSADWYIKIERKSFYHRICVCEIFILMAPLYTYIQIFKLCFICVNNFLYKFLSYFFLFIYTCFNYFVLILTLFHIGYESMYKIIKKIFNFYNEFIFIILVSYFQVYFL